MRIGNLRYKLLRPSAQQMLSSGGIYINAGSVRLEQSTTLRQIFGGVPGQLLTLTAVDNGLTLANGGGGNLRLQTVEGSNADVTLNANDSIQLVFDGTWWLEFGRTSEQGNQGLAGFQGPQGYAGFVGATGSDGAQGMAGPQGADGYQGFTGVAGNTGSNGPQGFDGPQGSQGAQGPDGAQGPNG